MVSYDSIPHAELMKSVARRISDGAVLGLMKRWLTAPVEETDDRGRTHRTTRNKDQGRGVPQGAPISPLLSNLYMRRFVLGWKVLGHEGRLDAHGNRHRKRTHLGAEKGPTCARLYPAGKVAGTTHLVFPFRLLMDSLKR